MNIKRAAVFLLLFQAVSLFAQELAARYNFQDFTQTPQKIKTLTIEPLFSFGVNGTNIVTGDRRTFVTDISGSKVVSNILAGYSYRVTIAGPYSTTVFTNYFGTNVTGLVSASDPEYLSVSANSLVPNIATFAVHATTADSAANAINLNGLPVQAFKLATLIEVEGDSNSSTNAAVGTHTWWYWFTNSVAFNQMFDNTTNIYNWSFPGDALWEMENQYPTNTVSLLPGQLGVKFQLGGINDIGDGRTSAQMISSYSNLLTKAKTEGKKVIAFTPMNDWLLTTTESNTLNAVAAWIRGATNQWDGLVDLNTAIQQSDTAGDAHLNTVGALKAANMALAALQGISSGITWASASIDGTNGIFRKVTINGDPADSRYKTFGVGYYDTTASAGIYNFQGALSLRATQLNFNTAGGVSAASQDSSGNWSFSRWTYFGPIILTNTPTLISTSSAPANVTIGTTTADGWFPITNSAGVRVFIPAWIAH